MGDPANRAETLEDVRARVKGILRRDLKLGPDLMIEDDMPLFNSDADLDSLDMLLLVSSVEREFGFRIPNESVGEAVFQNVDTLARFIAENRPVSSSNPAVVSSPVVDPLSRLPHADPFRFVSQLTTIRPGELAEGLWKITGNESFFAGHFPGKPLVPGVLVAEALAQLSGLVIAAPTQQQDMLAHVDVRFERPVQPPAELTLKSKLIRQVGSLQQFDVSAELNGTVVARGSLALHRAD